MFVNLTAIATLPASNIDRAKKSYSERLGLTPDMVQPDGSLFYKYKESAFLVYPSQFAGTAKNAMDYLAFNSR